MAPLSIPPELKKIKPFIQRAEELDKDKAPESRVVAYYCRQWAVQAGIPLSSSSPAAKKCLGELLGQLEGEKQAMSVFNRAESKQICRGFADKIFDRANMVDRSGAADKSTARTFYAAATFFEILQQFDDETTDPDTKKEEEERRVYAKWKATDILKAIREGRKPTAGAYGEDLNDDKKEEEDAADAAGGGAEEEEEQGSNTDVESAPDIFVPPSAPASGFAAPPAAPPSAPKSEPEEEEQPKQEEGTEVGPNGAPPPSYPGNNDNDDDGDVFVPGAVKSAASGIDRPPMAFNAPPPVVPPVMPKPVPPTKPSPQKSNKWGFGKKKSGTSVSKSAMEDAKELTRFALAALDGKNPDLAAERLQQALSALGR